jgi:hypothetical protein
MHVCKINTTTIFAMAEIHLLKLVGNGTAPTHAVRLHLARLQDENGSGAAPHPSQTASNELAVPI